jgi:hypothetical protein
LLYTLCVFKLIGQGGFRKRIDVPGSYGSKAIAAFETTPNNYLIISKTQVNENGFAVTKLDFINYNSLTNTHTIKQIGDTANTYNDGFSWIRNHGKKIGNHIYFAQYAQRVSQTKCFGVFLKLNQYGDTIWCKKYYRNNRNLYLYQSNKSNDGGFLLTGSLWDSLNTISQLLLIKTDANGNELWRKTVNGPPPNYYEGRDVIQDSVTKHIIVTGSVFKINSFGTQHDSKFVILFDSLGNQLHSLPATYQLDNSSSGILKDNLNNYYIFGYKVKYYDGLNPKSVGFITKFKITGNSLTQIYDKEVGEVNTSAAFVSISLDQEQNLKVIGIIDTSQAQNVLINYMVQVLKLNPNAEIIKKRYYSYFLNSNWEYGVGALGGNLTQDGGLIVPLDKIKNNAPRPAFFVKYDSTGCDTSAFYCATVGIRENNYQAADVSIYPQPANQIVNLSSPLFANKRAQIQISNNLGQLCFKQRLQFNNGTAQLPLANLPKGIYFLKLIDEDLKTFTQKIIVE